MIAKWHCLGTLAVQFAAFLLPRLSSAQDWPQFRYEAVASVPSPTQITAAGDGTQRLFATSQSGRIYVWRNGSAASVFLDLGARVLTGAERGLLGIAFPPGYATKRCFYVNYTRAPDGATVVSRFRVPAANPESADPASEEVILVVSQPSEYHNGGHIAFGPDGYLYIGMGDGGGTFFDQPNRAQNPALLLGKMLRLDVESGVAPYAIPASNPFVGQAGFRPEIWARGLRNPWRFSFDRLTGDLYVADVGELSWEEINFQPAGSPGGQNYGWNIREGMHFAFSEPPNFDLSTVTEPVAEYAHGEDGRSITGGYVYRGKQLPNAQGIYFCADLYGRVFGLRRQGQSWQFQPLETAGFLVTTFGEDEAGELYVSDYGGGRIMKVQVDPVVRPVTFNLGAGPYQSPITVRADCQTTNAVIRYTLDGSDPTESSPMFPPSGLIADGTVTVRARAYRAGFTPSSPTSQTYQFLVADLESGAVPGPVDPLNGRRVTLTSATPNCTIYYTLDGSDPDTSSTIYQEFVFLRIGPVTLKAVGRRPGYQDTPVLTQSFTKATQNPPIVFPSGLVRSGRPVTVGTASYQAEIHYTLDGSTPTRDSPIFPGPLTLTGPTVISAISYGPGYFDSPVTVATCFPVNDSPGTYETKAGAETPGFIDAPAGGNARFRSPEGICLESDTSALVADTGNHAIRRVQTSGAVTTVAGGQAGYVDGPAATARFSSPRALCRGIQNDFFVSDADNRRIRRIDSDGVVSTYAGSGEAGSADGPALQAQFDELGDVQMDPAGALFVGAKGQVRRISPRGQVSTVATLAGGGRVWLAFAPDGRLFASVEDAVVYEIVGGRAVVAAGTTAGYSDGLTTTARFTDVRALACDRLGYLAVGEADRVRRVYANGEVGTLIERHHVANGLAVDSVGGVWLAVTSRNLIVRYTPADWDGDGVPDGAEGGNSPFVLGVDDHAVDSDGDGTSNSVEYLTGTDPQFAGSVFRPALSVNGELLTLTWPTANNRHYWLEYSSDLRTWMVMFDLLGNGLPFQISQSTTGLHTRYYRVRVLFR